MTQGILQALQDHNPTYIVGMDEVGWGAIAGPVSAACAVFKVDWAHAKVKDSKRYSSETQREKAFDLVVREAVYFAYREVTPEELIAVGPGGALQQCFKLLAQNAVAKYPDSLVILDGTNKIKELEHAQMCLAKADDIVPAVSAASIIAKVLRDRHMAALGKNFPEYDWARNKGYGTPDHVQAMERVGVSVHHRHNIQMVLDCEKNYGTHERNRL